MGFIGFYGRFYEVYIGIFKELICRNIFFDDIGEIFFDIPYNGTFLDIMTYMSSNIKWFPKLEKWIFVNQETTGEKGAAHF